MDSDALLVVCCRFTSPEPPADPVGFGKATRLVRLKSGAQQQLGSDFAGVYAFLRTARRDKLEL